FSSYDYFAGAINSGESAWGTFHEIGHNYQQGSIWSWDGLGETTNNLFVFKTAHRMDNPAIANHPALQGAFTSALAYVQSTGSKNFANPGSPWTDDDNIPFFKLTPFLQIFNKVEGKNGESGWDFMPFLYTKARHSNVSFALNQAKIDFFYRTLCEFTGQDYFRFFNAWGIGLSNIARRDMRNTYPSMDKQIWTYQPLNGTGGEGALGSKYDLANALFTYTANFPGATQSGDNGGLTVLNDGNYGTAAAAGGTFFHTCYSGCPGPVPVPFIIDMDLGGLEAFKGIYYGNRANSGATVPRMVIYISNDKMTWQQIADFTNLPDTRPGRIEREFSQVYEARYVRVEFPQLASNGHIMLSELGLFYDN
ncbi:MAG TPA: M60 family metallopeptidase, partial [Sphingobacterium sp.]|nr:M60 family metallopeptidase [Sphingobacterium sp.]